MTEIISQLRAPWLRRRSMGCLSTDHCWWNLTGQVLLPERRYWKTLVMLWIGSGGTAFWVVAVFLLVGRGKKSQWAETHRSNSHAELCRRDIAGVSWQPSSPPSPPEAWPYSFLVFPEMFLYPYNKLFSVAKAHTSHFCYNWRAQWVGVWLKSFL